jgi:hypothetical protein
MPMPKKNKFRKIGTGMLSILKVPWKITNIVVFSLEKIGDGVRATPDVLMRSKKKSSHPKKRAPSNLASGYYYVIIYS